MDARARFARLHAAPDFGGQSFAAEINACMLAVIRANDRDPGVSVASVLLRQEGDYAIRHAVNVAIVTDQLLRALDHGAAHRTPVMAAALTMNLGMRALQNELSQLKGPLTPEQRQAMQKHPLASRDTLRKLGIADPLWLDCVAQHHEMFDGSGYPSRLKGDAIHFEARLLGMADRYCAMLNRASWRREQLADSAMLNVLGGPAGSPETKLGRLFTQTLGVYPAGALVQLLNGDIGMVKAQSNLETAPQVVSLFNAIWDPLTPPRLRDTRQEDYCIVAILNRCEVPIDIRMEDVWGTEALI